MPSNLLNASEAEGLVKTFLSSELALWLFIAACVGLAFYLVYKSVLYATFLLRLALGTMVVSGVFLGGFHLWLSTSAPVYLVIPGDPTGPLLLHGLDQARVIWRESQGSVHSSDDDEEDDHTNLPEQGSPHRLTHDRRRSLCDPLGNCPIETPSPATDHVPLFPTFDPYSEALKQRAKASVQRPPFNQQPESSPPPSSSSSAHGTHTTPLSTKNSSPESSLPRQETPSSTTNQPKDKPPPPRKKNKPKLADSVSWRSKFKLRNLLPAPIKRWLDSYWIG